MTSGDPDTQRLFLGAVQQYAARLKSYCLRRNIDAFQAEDIVQESFLKTFLFIRKGGVIRDMKPFLYCTVQHLMIDWIRAKKARYGDVVSLESLAEIGKEPSNGVDEVASVHNALDAEAIMEKCKKLHAGSCMLLVKRYLQGHSLKEIEKDTGIAAGNVAVRIHRMSRELSLAHRSGRREEMSPPIIVRHYTTAIRNQCRSSRVLGAVSGRERPFRH